ncbi:unnamed protein product [Schistosoma mattheei]|uniref:Uncharacterized protein n=1 Tax=Schistosoma mattheei TaxID=31246 RepID=A0A183NKG3_9TREM|nr:unnamed protein product [Schistosoma mattheei]
MRVNDHVSIISLVFSSTRMTLSLLTPNNRGTSLLRPFSFS